MLASLVLQALTQGAYKDVHSATCRFCSREGPFCILTFPFSKAFQTRSGCPVAIPLREGVQEQLEVFSPGEI